MNFEKIRKLDEQYKENERKFLKYKENYENKQQKIIDDKKNILFLLFEKSELSYEEFIDIIIDSKNKDDQQIESENRKEEVKE